ncbi:MAG: antiterminator LoaP [Lachnospiraceae bacterium]|nr:antiterminator LoaP [Lachnospiraceae bacterium]
MMYVIQVETGQEAVTIKLIEEIFRMGNEGALIEEVFFPQRERTMKYEGSWKKVTEKLFPGYLFLKTSHMEEARILLRRVPRLTKLLGVDEDAIYPLSKEEIDLIYSLCGKEHLAQISDIEIKEGNKVNILSGPLKNLEGKIVKINLHKRVALVRVRFMKNDVTSTWESRFWGKKKKKNRKINGECSQKNG